MTSEEDTTTKSSSSPLSALQDNIETKGKNSYYFAHAHKANGPKWDGHSEPRLLVKHSDSNLVVVGESETVTVDQNSNNNHNHNNTIDANMEQNISNHAQSLIQSLKEKKSSFDFSKSTITKYAFIDEGKKVKLYIDLKGVGDVCNVNEDVTLDWDERSFSLKVLNYVVPAAAMAVKEGDGEDEGEGKDNTDDDNSREKGNGKDVQCLSFGRLHGFISKAAVKVKKDRIIVTLWKKVDEESEDDPEDWPQIAKKGDGEDY